MLTLGTVNRFVPALYVKSDGSLSLNKLLPEPNTIGSGVDAAYGVIAILLA